MDVALEQFVKQLADSGIIAPGKLENFVPPKAQPKDPQELAHQLVQSKQLTRFQAQEIYAGRAKSLILGNYTILDKIGAGGMGQVFKAEHRRMHRVVAIKMLPKSVTKDAAAAARFQREVEAAAKLEHPNIVTAYDADEAAGVHFLVMQYIEGSDLSALVKKNGPLPIAKAVNCILQAARGLEFAHKHGVVHRDIKPANLLLDSEGTVKILDMGLARIDAGDDAATQAELTGTRAVFGTVDYMAPEQAISAKHADARADIYSLGCSLHFLLTGKTTYDGDSLMAKLLAHRDMPIPSLGTEAPEQIQAVFQKMVAKKVEDRYQTMSEVVAALEPCCSSQQTTVRFQRSDDTIPADAGASTFVKDATTRITQKLELTNATTLAEAGKSNKKVVLGLIGAGFLGLAILAAVIFKMQTKAGTLVIEVDQPDAVVQVLNEDGGIEVTRSGEKGPISISVDPGKRRLQVAKDGFILFRRDFEMPAGGTTEIKVALEPLKKDAVGAITETKNRSATLNSPAFQQWMKTVAALPADKRVEAVAKKLQDLNPGFDGKETHTIEGGLVTELAFSTDDVTDISPVRALHLLKSLECNGSGPRKGKLFDLSPLSLMQLTTLSFNWTQVSDLSPLKGMPLTILACRGTEVSDLSPLKGMLLTNLACHGTQVSDLSPLKKMPLTHLDFGASRVSDLAPLKGMPLILLICEQTPVSDLSPVHGMHLDTLYCNGTRVFDLSPLEGMTLSRVWFTPTHITKGIDILRQMKSIRRIGLGLKLSLLPREFWKKYDAGEFK